MREALAYSKERVQFGHAVSEFQAIQWMFADMGTELEAAELMTFRAASLKDSGRPHTREAAMAKLFASEAAMRATIKAVQVFGGYGYTQEYPAERYMRDAKLCEIGEGTSEVQRIIIARDLIRSH
jgi:alkylation response protein AidB-like acyl-CoA dehydrogenase